MVQPWMGPYTRYCRCGHPVRTECFWNGLAYVPLFFDGDTDDPRTITHCPSCGEWLFWFSLRCDSDEE